MATWAVGTPSGTVLVVLVVDVVPAVPGTVVEVDVVDVVVVASGMTVVVLEEAGGIVVVLVVTEAGAPRLGSVVVVDPRLRIAGRSSPPPQDARRAQMVTTRQMPVRRIASF